jgi:hypothetical protein
MESTKKLHLVDQSSPFSPIESSRKKQLRHGDILMSMTRQMDMVSILSRKLGSNVEQTSSLKKKCSNTSNVSQAQDHKRTDRNIQKMSMTFPIEKSRLSKLNILFLAWIYANQQMKIVSKHSSQLNEYMVKETKMNS